MRPEAALHRIETLLKDERAALLGGNLRALPELLAKRDSLLSGLAVGADDRPRLRELRRLAQRNTELAAAARAGIQAAAARVSAIRAAAGPIGSYSATGARQDIGTARPAFERKA